MTNVATVGMSHPHISFADAGFNGVLHAVGGSLKDLDVREVGYNRIEIPLSEIQLYLPSGGVEAATWPVFLILFCGYQYV